MKPTNIKSFPNDAAGWDARLRSSACTSEERKAFHAWCQEDPENEREYDKLRQLLSALRASSDAPEIRALREWATDDSAKPWHKHRFVRGGFAAAAAVSFMAIGMWMLQFGSIGQENLDTGMANAYTTAIGERSTANLDDGSIAELNTNTQLNIEFTENERRVNLVEGQAFFDVAKDPARPFVVIAGDQRIEAIGTAFDVYYMDGQVKVTLVEGIVNVAPQALDLPAEITVAAVRMEAGQALTTTAVASQLPPVVETTDTQRDTIWRTGRAFFEDASLADAVAEMNRYSSTQIRVEGAALDYIRMNGMFRTGQQANFVETLAAYYPIKAIQDSENVIILKLQ